MQHAHAADDRWSPVCAPFAAVCSRVATLGQNVGGIVGYCLAIDRSSWRLVYGLGCGDSAASPLLCGGHDGAVATTETTLRSGKLERTASLHSWHELRLTVSGSAVRAAINGTVVAAFTDSAAARARSSGLAALASAEIPGIEFDDLRVERA